MYLVLIIIKTNGPVVGLGKGLEEFNDASFPNPLTDTGGAIHHQGNISTLWTLRICSVQLVQRALDAIANKIYVRAEVVEFETFLTLRYTFTHMLSNCVTYVLRDVTWVWGWWFRANDVNRVVKAVLIE